MRYRPIVWGSALTFARIFSTVIISYITYKRPITGLDGIAYVIVPPLYVALFFIAEFLMFFSLPLAIAIEAYLYLKGRKGEAKENEEIA